ncbi:hypothetical protein H6P81_018186 [Aristolochia fimbriata]|uniref:PQL-like protein n=1 Tax=Aristolochia fimbriata TaxID=158543 RepID=A0AAV7E4K1_ARIFI|nr:hypothetical protein H6P81_018186 [Aristolochia fimbriata]
MAQALMFSALASSSPPSVRPAIPPRSHQESPTTSRRNALKAAGALGTALAVAREALCNSSAAAFDFRITVPDQTLEEAEAGVKAHARELLGIKSLIELRSWKEVQKSLRESSAKLKQDIYTIINQGTPGNQRPLLRQLYSKLFNGVTRLDYAARSEDAGTVQECYDTIVESLNEIFSKV